MEIDIATFTKNVGSFFKKYHLLIFFTAISIGMGAVIFMLNSVVVSTDDAHGYTSTVNDISLDQMMIERMRDLRGDDETSKKLNFSGRISPF